ncbi:unnamed protein product [Paramecium sonneborni]|uniref:Uncharacterized protein n=1 Tax=Paramecium sonneborni TaxID=65129 RepID=A0A8S1QZ15_9CILI|nr:unnamed protein product [Paramecium sonneborni]
MNRFQIIKVSLLLIDFIRQTIQCDSNTLEGCLINKNIETTEKSLKDLTAYGYGFWFQYISTQLTLYESLLTFSQIEGLLLLREVNPENQQFKTLFYQDWTNKNENQEKYLYLKFELNNEMIQQGKFIFNSFTFEGRWIYIYISYQIPNEKQIILYDNSDNSCQRMHFQQEYNLQQDQTFIIQGGELQKINDNEKKVYAYYPGRISRLYFNSNQNEVIFQSDSQFEKYLNIQFIPQAVCQTHSYDSNLIENYIYQYGLIQLESWVKIDYNLNINYSASVFGVEIFFMPSLNGYQKLVDLQYCLLQAWTADLANGVYFQTYNQDSPDFYPNYDQFFDKQDIAFHTLEQDLKQWHYVSILYGFDKQQMAVSNLRMWFIDGHIYDVQYHNKTYHFEGNNIKMRSGLLFSAASDGMFITTESSKITICIPDSYDLIKKCHYSCQDCNGPFLDQCIICDTSSNRYLENGYCKCSLSFIENNYGQCIQLIHFYPNSVQQYNSKNQTLSQFGFFPINNMDNETIYLRCPQFNQNQSQKISCIECLSQPQQFAKELKCKSDYIFNEYNQYELIQRNENDIELYIIDEQTSSITLCVGCKQICNRDVNENCYMHTLLQVAITCQSQFFYKEGECQACHPNCQTCSDFAICTSCFNLMTLNIKKNECLKCPKECTECEYQMGIKQKCYPCGNNCLECQFIQDSRDGSYYNRCKICLDNKKYYLSINAIDCIENQDTQCKFAIQFHKSWLMRTSVNTMFYMFEKGDFNSNQIINYCALCDEGYASLLTGQCVRIDSLPVDTFYKQYCTQMYQMEKYYALELNIQEYICLVYTQEIRQLFSVSNGCDFILQNCAYCFSNTCLLCYPGYYTQLVSGQCIECPKQLNCYKCEQRSKIWKNGWKVWYGMVHFMMKRNIFYDDIFGNESQEQLEVVCKTCTIDYEFYQDKCIKKCPDNCELCVKNNGQNQCMKCKMYEGRPLSLYNGICIDCPRYCQICKPKFNDQLRNTNPYFSNEKVISSTHTCLMLQIGLNYQDYYYNTNFQQFFKLSTTGTDPNSIIFQFNLYCSIDLYNQQLELASDQQLFLHSNVRIDELVTNNKSQSNFGRIENLNLFTYLSIQQIQEVELQFTLIQDCILNEHSYIFTTLIQNIFFMNIAKIKLLGNGNTLFLKSNFEILNFDSIVIENLIIIPYLIVNIHLQSLSVLSVTIHSVVIQQQKEDQFPVRFTILSTNLNYLQIYNFTTLNLKLQSVTSLFQLEYSANQKLINIYFDGFTIRNSNLQNSNIILLDNYAQESTNCDFNNILITNSTLSSSQFLTTLNHQQLYITGSISQIVIQFSILSNIQPLFLTNSMQNLNIRGIFLENSSFKNFSLFQVSAKSINKDYYISNCQFYNSSIIVSLLQQQFEYANFDSIHFFQVQHDESTVFIKLSSNSINSKVIITNILLSEIILQDNVSLAKSLLSIQSIIFISSNYIHIYNVQINRSQGLSEFQLSSADNLILENITITLIQNYFYKSINTNNQCSKQIKNTKYTNFLTIQKVQNITIKNISISNLIVSDVPLIYIVSIATQVMRRQEIIIIEHLNISNCIILNTQAINQISNILIQSEQQIEIDIKNSFFNDNIYFSYFKEKESESALIIVIIAYYSKIQLFDCKFIQNYVCQSQNTLLYLYGEQIKILQSSFVSNNRMFENFINHVNWQYRPFTITLDEIENQFQVLSQSGNGNLIASSIQIKNTNILDSFSIQAGCFKIILENEGLILIQNSLFKNINTQISQEQSYGGCFYVIDRSINIQINMLDSIYQTIIGTAIGGIIYLKPNAQQINFNFTNLTIIDVFSNDGNIAQLNFLNYEQSFYMSNCVIIQTLEGYIKFRSILKEIKKYELTMISIQQGYIILRNVFAKLYLNILLYLTYQSKISFTSIEIDDSYYYQKPIISVSFAVDQISKIEINGLKIKNLKLYIEDPSLSIIQIQQKIEDENKFILDCQNNYTIKLKNSTYKLIKLQELLEQPQDYIKNLVEIINVKNKDQISIKQSQFLNNTCSNCQQGLFYLRIIEEQSNNIFLQNIWLMDNNCGQRGCLQFVQDDESKKNNSISVYTIDTMFCYRNYAKRGGCVGSKGIGIKIANSILSQNIAGEQGGGVYYEGQTTNFIFQNNLIVSNTAKEGGAIYLGTYNLPELNKTLNYLNNNSAYQYGNTSSSHSTQLTVLYRNTQFRTLHVLENGILNAYISNSSDFSNKYILKLPSGQKISSYQYFNMIRQEYENLNLKFRVLALNAYKEQQYNLNNTICIIESGIQQDQKDYIFTNNYTNYNRKVFDLQTQDYNLDDLILYYGNEVNESILILKISCDSVEIPIYDEAFPYQINNYNSKYFLYLYIQTFPCQLGEYKNLTDNACYLCDIKKKQYSVTRNATECNFMDEDTTISITPAQIQLKSGYWRPHLDIQIVEYCQNRIENCLGGWTQGDESCAIGQIGACCESCDHYNTRGQGQYSQQKLYQCQKCEDLDKQILYIILIILWNLFSIYLSTNGVKNMILELQRNKIGTRQLLINHNKQTGPIMKMFVNYLQIVAIILNFNVEIPQVFKDYYNIVGNSQTMLLITTDCFLAQNFQAGLIYVKIIYSIICPIVYGLIFLFIYFIMKVFNKIDYNQVVITTCILYLFCYYQIQVIQLLISSLSFRTLSGIKWIQANLSYSFDAQSHQQWIPYLITLTIIIGAIIPGIFTLCLTRYKDSLQRYDIRRQWGFLYLEYQPKAYFWEIIRIISREMIIIAITFYQDNLVIKCTLLFIIMFAYSYTNYIVLPFKTKKFNQLEQKSILLCTFTLFAVLSLSQTNRFYTIILFSVILTNLYILITFLKGLINGYLQAYEELIDKIKDFLKDRLKSKLLQYQCLDRWFINKSQRRKLVIEKYKKIKKYLYSVRKKLVSIERNKFSQISTYRSTSGLISPRDYNIVFLRPQQILSTNSENNLTNNAQTNLIKKIIGKE